MQNNIQNLISFINSSPSSFHAVNNSAEILKKNGFTELFEGEDWKINLGGKYFVTRNMSSIIAFKVPRNEFWGFVIGATHTDSPSFKLKDNFDVEIQGGYIRACSEKYGGMISASWLDRPLSAAGRITVFEDGEIRSKLFDFEDDLFIIPSLAIHLNRDTNEKASYNPAVDMQPICGLGKKNISFDNIISQKIGISKENIISKDLFLYPTESGKVFGINKDIIISPRLDDLECHLASLLGFIDSKESKSIPVFCSFDNEEVGSSTKQGAESTFLRDSLLRICESLGFGVSEYLKKLASSFMVSADNAHAIHPNHPEMSDAVNRPMLNEGIVIKHNANQRYTTDSVSAAIFTKICNLAGVPYQHYTNRADIVGGSTLGNISSTKVSVNTVDIGLSQLAMHSSYETAGVHDYQYLISAMRQLYSSSIKSVGSCQFKII